MNFNHYPPQDHPYPYHQDEYDLHAKFQNLNMDQYHQYSPTYPTYNYTPILTQPAFPNYPPQTDHRFQTPPMGPFQSPSFQSNAWSTPPMSPAMGKQWAPFQMNQRSQPFVSPSRPPAERKPYHPQAPAQRSEWVMWVGNVPSNTSHEELWRYFNNLPGERPWRGPSSIFLISRSSCAFVNLSSQDDLERAVAHFHNRPLRPWDQKCPRLVCRVRKQDDDLRAGVGGQRGTGMHKEWVANRKSPEPSPQDEPPEGEGRRRESIIAKHHSSASCASTNSSFLTKHFPRRIFILKSWTTAELEESVQSSTWRLQKHNEPILDQAFRTAQEVFLIFGANGAGGFFGYAKMVEPIDKEKAASRASKSSKASEDRPGLMLTSSQSRIASCSPGEMSPAIFDEVTRRGERRTESLPARDKRSSDHLSIASAPAGVKDSYFPSVMEEDALKQQAKGGSSRPQQLDDNGVLRKDTALTPEIKPADDGRGRVFSIEWVKVGGIPFTRTRQYRNPWNQDREVKVSRDGTELEPGVGTRLMAEWDTPLFASV